VTNYTNEHQLIFIQLITILKIPRKSVWSKQTKMDNSYFSLCCIDKMNHFLLAYIL